MTDERTDDGIARSITNVYNVDATHGDPQAKHGSLLVGAILTAVSASALMSSFWIALLILGIAFMVWGVR